MSKSSSGTTNRIRPPGHLTLIPEGLLKRPILGLDFGERLGYAFALPTKDGGWEVRPEYIGVVSLKLGTFDSGAVRFLRLRELLLAANPSAIAFEDTMVDAPMDIPRAKATAIVGQSMKAMGAFTGVAVEWAEEIGIPAVGYKIAQIKKFATNKGNSGKPAMIKACNEKFGTDLDPVEFKKTGDDNAADAAWVVAMLIDEYGESLKTLS